MVWPTETVKKSYRLWRRRSAAPQPHHEVIGDINFYLDESKRIRKAKGERTHSKKSEEHTAEAKVDIGYLCESGVCENFFC